MAAKTLLERLADRHANRAKSANHFESTFARNLTRNERRTCEGPAGDKFEHKVLRCS
jgi:hypothetical protein